MILGKVSITNSKPNSISSKDLTVESKSWKVYKNPSNL